ncbi:hypothetical protein NliqN6_3457 [Naganishia liquefaciens]|uniref:Uncharacterized protein n=1 Tax=Naganishia liquefaciens TaxID=104408 RepID=A0A8H3YEW9_9TREE|nr:hypothetical protein NliqN6_3457 [Naganishia liquefaciens]
MLHQLRVLGLLPRSAGTGNVHGCDGRVITIPGTRHAEDMHYHPRSGLLFAACDGPQSPRFHWYPPAAHFEDPERVPTGVGRGELVVVNPKVGRQPRQLALEGFTGAFVTQGIDIVDDPYDPFSIYIHTINHCPLDPVPTSGKPADRARSQIEVFRHALGSGTARYIRSVYHPLVRTPNDLYSISPGEILVTNDHKYRSGAMRMLEDVVSHRWGPKTDLVRLGFRLDGYQQGDVVGTIALSGLHNCNGLGHGPNGQVLLTDAAGGVLHVCSWDAYAGLGIDSSIQLESTIDNPSYYASKFDSEAGYVLAGLARAYTLPRTNRDPNGLEPAIVWYVPLGGSPRILFQDDGRVLRSASTAVIVDDEHSRERWLFVTGFHAEAIVAVKIEL